VLNGRKGCREENRSDQDQLPQTGSIQQLRERLKVRALELHVQGYVVSVGVGRRRGEFEAVKRDCSRIPLQKGKKSASESRGRKTWTHWVFVESQLKAGRESYCPRQQAVVVVELKNPQTPPRQTPPNSN
jgi:hypothetical protein